MCAMWKHRTFGIIVLTAFTALVLLARPMGAGQSGPSGQEADGVGVLKGTIDMHFHVTRRPRTGAAYRLTSVKCEWRVHAASVGSCSKTTRTDWCAGLPSSPSS